MLCSVALVAGSFTGQLPAEDQEIKAKPSRNAATERSTSLAGRRSTAPQMEIAQASAEDPAAEPRFEDDPDDLDLDDKPNGSAADDDDLAAWSDGPGNQLISRKSSPLAGLSAPEGDDPEIEFDPSLGDFQRVRAGDDQQYLVPPSDDEPLGWVGMEFHRPTDLSGSDFFPVPDRYRMGFPDWNRYTKGSPLNPYQQNVLKGDYPILVGGNTFLQMTAVSDTNEQARRKLIAVAGNAKVTKLQTDTQHRERLFFTTDYFEDDGTFTPSPWLIRLTQVVEYRDQSDAVGYHDDYAFVEAFADYRIAFLSDYGDQINGRVGRQAFNADFRGFLFNDVQDMARIFGTWNENKWQYNFLVMDAVQADPVTQFLGFYKTRNQDMIGGNVFRNDVPLLGFNVMGGAFYVHDKGTAVLNAVDPLHQVDVAYLELAAQGVIGGFGFSGAFIEAVGRDAMNPVAQRAVDVNGQFAALEVTRPTDWFTPRTSFMYSSGDKNPKGGTATGFDAVSDNPNFAGNNFSYLGREQEQGRGIQIKNFNSFTPNLRNRFFDAENFVNPGLVTLTAGLDTTLTTRVNAFFNYNYYQFVQPAAIEAAIAEKGGGNLSIAKDLGQDITLGVNFRPLIVNNVTCNIGTTGFFQGKGFQAISGNNAVLFTHFANLVLVY
jgi:hypothetical protein